MIITEPHRNQAVVAQRHRIFIVPYLYRRAGSYRCSEDYSNVIHAQIRLVPLQRAGSATEESGEHDRRICQRPLWASSIESTTLLRSSPCWTYLFRTLAGDFQAFALLRARGRAQDQAANLPSCSSISSHFTAGANRWEGSWSPARHRIPVPGRGSARQSSLITPCLTLLPLLGRPPLL